MKEFNENDAIRAMRVAIPEGSPRYDDDELLNIIDMIWDYYEENGMLDIDLEEDLSLEEDLMGDLVEYVTRMLKKDKGARIIVADVPALVAAELAYEESLMDDDEED